MKICIVAETYQGPRAFGAAGAGLEGLRERLAQDGDDVTILIADLFVDDEPSIASGEPVVRLSDVVRADPAMTWPVLPTSRAYAVYRYLAASDFDEAHFVEHGGLGFYAALAGAQGGLHARVVTHLAGPSRWRRALDLEPPDLMRLETEIMERVQCENSACVVAPSQSARAAFEALGWSAPNIAVFPRTLSAGLGGGARTRGLRPNELRHLVFIGRQQVSDGFDLFIDLAEALRDLDLTVIGPFGRIDGEFGASRMVRRMGSGRIRFLDNLESADAARWLRRKSGILCILPAPDRFGAVGIDECLAAGAPFLASDVGGAGEALAPESRAEALTDANGKAFTAAVRRILSQGQPPIRAARPHLAPPWRAIVAAKPAEPPPLVSVCIAHHDRPRLLERALDHLMRQTYARVEIIVVDDGSRNPETFARLDELETRAFRFPVRILRAQNRYLGAARNLAARHAHGEYLLFHDDDNFAEPNEIEVFVAAAQRTGCALLTCHFWVVREGENDAVAPSGRKIEAFFLGAGGAPSMLANRFGDANALVRRDVFEALGGFSELSGIGLEDWEFFLRAHLRGVKIAVVPEPLFNYRVHPTGMLSAGAILPNRERIFALLEKEGPRLDPDLARLAARPSLEAEMRERWLRVFADTPEGLTHAEILDLDLGSPRLAERLADLSRAFESPSPELAGGDEPAFFVSGWAFLDPLTPYAPTLWRIDGRLFETIATVCVPRPDVNASFALPDAADVGFQSLLRLSRRRGWGKRGRRLPASGSRKLETLDGVKQPLNAHIDIAEPQRLRAIRPPAPDWTGALQIANSTPGLCALWSDGVLTPALGPRVKAEYRRRIFVGTSLKSAFAIVAAEGEPRIEFD